MRPPSPVSIDGELFVWELLDPGSVDATRWAHPGAAIEASGETLVTSASSRSLIRYRAGEIVGRIGIEAVECHGLAAAEDGSVWIADPGEKLTWKGSWSVHRGPGRVVRFSESAGVLAELAAPSASAWKPTGVAVGDFGRSCDGRVFVSDGYGSEMVHCYSVTGDLLWSRTGEEDGTRFSTPHGICVDERGTEASIVIADRGNARLVELTIDGQFIRQFGVDELSSPSGLVVRDDLIWVSELFGSVKVFDRLGRLVGEVGEDEQPSGAWPNVETDDGVVAPTVADGEFRSPHGIALDGEGGVIVAEWVLGGRVSRLRPLVRAG